LLDGHTAYIPDQDKVSLHEGTGDAAMTDNMFVTYGSGNHHFYIGTSGSRWEADDTNSGSTNNTYHQIWVRANKAPSASLSNMTIPKVLDITGAVFDAAAVNYANVYLYGTDGVNAKHDALATKVVDYTLDAQWNASAKYWRVKVLSLGGEGVGDFAPKIVDDKILGGSIVAMNPPVHFGQLRLQEFALLESDGTFFTPIDITLTNSIGTTYANMQGLQNNSYTGDQLNAIISYFYLKEYINIDYTFNEPKQIARIHLANPGPQRVGCPIDMEVYNSMDGSVWTMHSRMSYQTNDMPYSDGTFGTIYIGDTTTVLKYDSINYRWYYDSASGTTESITISEAQNEYPYPNFNTPYVPRTGTLNPHVQITNVSDVTSNSIKVSGTVFSSVANITGVHAAVFDPSVDLSDTVALAAFVNNPSFGADLSVSANRYAVGSFTDFALNTGYYSALSGGTTLLEEGNKYSVVVAATDANGNTGVAKFIPSFLYKNSLTDFFHIPVDTNFASVLNQNGGGWSVVFELKLDSIEKPEAFDIMSVNDNLTNGDNLNYGYNNLHNFGIRQAFNGKQAWVWTGTKRQYASPTLSTPYVPPLNEWVRFALTKNQYSMIHGNQVLYLSAVPGVNNILFDSMQAGTHIAIGHGQRSAHNGHWTGNIRNIAIFNTNINLSTDLPEDLSTMTQVSHPSLVSFFNGYSESSTLGYPVTGLMSSSIP
jgi:hypothetical protein